MSNNKLSGIYAIVSITTGQKYIGASSDILKRWAGHLSDLRGNRHHSAKLQSAFDVTQESGLRLEIIELIDSVENFADREQYYIEKYDAIANGFNANKGSLRGDDLAHVSILVPQQMLEWAEEIARQKGMTLTEFHRELWILGLNQHKEDFYQRRVNADLRNKALSEDEMIAYVMQG